MKSLLSVSETCKDWYRVSRYGCLWIDFNRDMFGRDEGMMSRVFAMLGDLSKRTFTEKGASDRIEFLFGTVLNVREYMFAQKKDSYWIRCRHQFLVHVMLRCLFCQLRDIDEMLHGIIDNSRSMTCNFDILELSLRRTHEELRTLIPASDDFDPPGRNGYDGIPDPRIYSVIKDRDARVSWLEEFGNERCYVPYDTFFDRIGRFIGAKTNSRFARHLKFHLGFPTSNIVTTYRYNVLISIFGPFKDFSTNFSNIALKNGFVGLVNMLTAEDILIRALPSLKTNTYLIRYSRRQPEVLAFSSINIMTNRIEHRRNVDSAGNFIPVATFIRKIFNGYQPIHMGIDDNVTTMTSTFTFASRSNPYVMIDPVVDITKMC